MHPLIMSHNYMRSPSNHIYIISTQTVSSTQSHTISTPGTTTNAPTNAAHRTLVSAPTDFPIVLTATAVPDAAFAVFFVMVPALAVRVTTTTLALPSELNAPGLNVKPVLDGKPVVAAAEGEAVR